MPHLTTASELREQYRDALTWPTPELVQATNNARSAMWASMEELVARGDLNNSDRRAYQFAETELRNLGKLKDELDVAQAHQLAQRSTVPIPGGPTGGTSYRDGAPLTGAQTVRGYAESRGLLSDVERQEPLSVRKCLRGAMFGTWGDAEAERRAMSGLSGAAGGFRLPVSLTAEIVDLARAQMRVAQAGARFVPMAERQVDIAKWVQDPTPGWRAEGAPIVESDGALAKVTLSAKSLAVHTKITRELLEDADEVEDQLRQAFAAGFAQKVDAAALYGGETDGPVGLRNTAAVTKTALATNGATPSWAALVASVGRVRDANEDPTAVITADRTLRSLSLIAGSDGQYIAAPSYLDGVQRLATGQVPTNRTTGTSTDTADAFVGDFRHLWVGVRTGLEITLLTERFMVEAGSYALVGWWRGDVVVTKPAAFDVITGIRP